MRMLSMRRVLSRPSTFSSSRISLLARSANRGFHGSPIVAQGLKILFCGSDAFSVQSLKTLIELKNATQNESIESIDVLVKHEKPSGRGLMAQRVNPVQVLAREYSLPYHEVERNAFNSWNLPGPTDLIVAVSFGLFIPKNLIEQSRYGGLNVHPSFLPRGAAPVQHALVNGDPTTGVVVQTLDVEKFDNGRILAKSDPIPIRIDKTAYPDPRLYDNLLQTLGEEGGKLLAAVIKDGLYDPAKYASLDITTGETPKFASKLPTKASLIRFGEMAAWQAFRLGLVFNNLYCFRVKLKRTSDGVIPTQPARVIVGPVRMPTSREFDRYLSKAPVDLQWVHIPTEKSTGHTKGKHSQDPGDLALQVSDGNWVVVKYLTVEGKKMRDAKSWADNVDPKDVRLVTNVTAVPEEGKNN
ncbi:hypothetical protein Dda_3978 [Drechslerella dactyloides]|uniref:methionyl-tRNA formyltransferase n=1 Tax=Drechslerella dactyloides TaxID=74499 RepID=A0AAD6NK09_DREDA|nr:hypothetical protein Dda_3978 [Drechslerella dactyloides]